MFKLFIPFSILLQGKILQENQLFFFLILTYSFVFLSLINHARIIFFKVTAFYAKAFVLISVKPIKTDKTDFVLAES